MSQWAVEPHHAFATGREEKATLPWHGSPNAAPRVAWFVFLTRPFLWVTDIITVVKVDDGGTATFVLLHPSLLAESFPSD